MKSAIMFPSVFMILLFAACGSGTVPGGYMASSSHSVMFIDWTNNKNQLTGTLQLTYLDSSYQLHSQNTQLHGVISGSNISLTLSLWGFPTKTYVGTISHDQLTLSIPQSDGTLQTVVFTPATTDDYTTAVHSLQATATTQQNTVTAQHNAEATAQAISAAQSQLNAALSALQRDSDFSGILSSYSNAITSAQNDLQSEEQIVDCDSKKYYEGQ